MLRHLRAAVALAAMLLLALPGTANAGGTFEGAFTVSGNGTNPGSVTAQAAFEPMGYCQEPDGTARVEANVMGSVSLTLAPSSPEYCWIERKLPPDAYEIRWSPGIWDTTAGSGTDCSIGEHIGDVTVDADGYGGPTVSDPFNPGDPGPISICVTNASHTWGHQVPLWVLAEGCSVDAPPSGSGFTPLDLYAVGRDGGPPYPRQSDLEIDLDGNVCPGATDDDGIFRGLSAFASPQDLAREVTGQVWMLPAWTPLPDLLVMPDGKDYDPESPMPSSHHTIYPTSSMGYAELRARYQGLRWDYVGHTRDYP